MQIEISRGYRRDIRDVRDAVLRRRLDVAIAAIAAASAVQEIPGVGRVRHPRVPYYRVRVGKKHRLVFEPVGDTAVLVRFGHRKNVYKNLPG